MFKTIAQLIMFAGIFMLMWWGLSNVQWVKTFKINQFTKEKQEQLSELVLEMYGQGKKEVTDSAGLNGILKIRNVLCLGNGLDTAQTTLHVFEDEVVNAFALPGGHIVINTGLIRYCDNADMLAGVMAHEISHVELEHVSRKLAREVGMTSLLIITGGSEHIELLKEVLYTLTSRSFDRDMEREADAHAVFLMQNTGADARQLAFFLKKLSRKQADMPNVLQWINTHPATDERVKAILSTVHNSSSVTGIISNEEWDEIKSRYAEY